MSLEGTLNVGRAALAAEMVGASRGGFHRTVAYLRERKQFGKLIGEFQALQHRAADLYCELEVTPLGGAEGAADARRVIRHGRRDRLGRQGAGRAKRDARGAGRRCRCTAASG